MGAEGPEPDAEHPVCGQAQLTQKCDKQHGPLEAFPVERQPGLDPPEGAGRAEGGGRVFSPSRATDDGELARNPFVSLRTPHAQRRSNQRRDIGEPQRLGSIMKDGSRRRRRQPLRRLPGLRLRQSRLVQNDGQRA